MPRTRILLRGATAACPLRASQRALNLHYDLLALYDLLAHVVFLPSLFLCTTRLYAPPHTYAPARWFQLVSGLVGRMRPD